MSTLRPRHRDAASEQCFTALQALREDLRSQLKMEVAFVSMFKDGLRQFEHVSASSGERSPSVAGSADPIEDSYRQLVVDGRLPQMMKPRATTGPLPPGP